MWSYYNAVPFKPISQNQIDLASITFFCGQLHFSSVAVFVRRQTLVFPQIHRENKVKPSFQRPQNVLNLVVAETLLVSHYTLNEFDQRRQA